MTRVRFWQEYSWLRHAGIGMFRAARIAARRVWQQRQARQAAAGRAAGKRWRDQW